MDDSLSVIFGFLTESERINVRAACRRWNTAVIDMCLKINIIADFGKTLKDRNVISAVIPLIRQIQQSPRGDWTKARQPREYMKDACSVPHYGAISFILGVYGRSKLDRFGGALASLYANHDEHTHIEARVSLLFMQYGYGVPRYVNIDYATRTNCTELLVHVVQSRARQFSYKYAKKALYNAADNQNTAAISILVDNHYDDSVCDPIMFTQLSTRCSGAAMILAARMHDQTRIGCYKRTISAAVCGELENRDVMLYALEQTGLREFEAFYRGYIYGAQRDPRLFGIRDRITQNILKTYPKHDVLFELNGGLLDLIDFDKKIHYLHKIRTIGQVSVVRIYN